MDTSCITSIANTVGKGEITVPKFPYHPAAVFMRDLKFNILCRPDWNVQSYQIRVDGFLVVHMPIDVSPRQQSRNPDTLFFTIETVQDAFDIRCTPQGFCLLVGSWQRPIFEVVALM